MVPAPSPPASAQPVECSLCGACCVAPDIAALDKPIGARCPYLGDDCRCTVYEARPDACRRYEPDELCLRIAAETLGERVERYLAIFGLAGEAAHVRDAGVTSMREARRLPLLR